MLLRGCEKRVIHIRNTDNDYFEEAFFFLKPGDGTVPPQKDLSREAERIVSESLICGLPATREPVETKHPRVRMALCFIAGLICGIGGTVAILL